MAPVREAASAGPPGSARTAARHCPRSPHSRRTAAARRSRRGSGGPCAYGARGRGTAWLQVPQFRALAVTSVHPDIKWTFAPAILLSVALWAGVYVWRFRQARREAGGRGAGWKQALAFGGFVLVLLIALVSPIDALGEDYLFSMHMTQHILLGDIAPLLLLLSLSRVIMRPATRRFHALERKLGRLANPYTFVAIWFALLYFWHIPTMYVAAIQHPLIHALEHLCFFIAGCALWWPLIQPVPMRYKLTGIATMGYVLAA